MVRYLRNTAVIAASVTVLVSGLVFAAARKAAAGETSGASLPPHIKLLVSLCNRMMIYDGTWKDVTADFGFSGGKYNHDELARAGEKFFAVGSSTRSNHHIIDIATMKIRPVPLVLRERFVSILNVGESGAVWWRGSSLNRSVLWKHVNGRNTALISRPGSGGYDIGPNGAVCWTVNPGIGRGGSDYFPEFIPGYQTVLYWSASPGVTERALAKSGAISEPRFVDADQIAYWRDGPIDKASKSKEWILCLVQISTGKITELKRLKAGMWLDTPTLIVGRGVLGWQAQWMNNRNFEFSIGGKVRSVSVPYPIEAVSPCEKRYTDGRVVFFDSSTEEYTVYDPLTDVFSAGIHIGGEGQNMYWAETVQM